LYAPEAYYARLGSFLRYYRPARRKISLPALQPGVVLRALWGLGMADRWRSRFWGLLLRALGKGPDGVMAYLRQAVLGYFVRRDIAEYAPAPHLGL
jgi:hypothetical protein